MSGEWQKSTVLDLITTYKENENLYNPKHKLYYNKQARTKSLQNIIRAVEKTKSDVTMNDVIKKIQILRTQFGQEIQKIEKSKKLLGGNDDELIYVPKIWWFKHLQFIANYMKIRSQSTSLSTSLKLEQHKNFNESVQNDNTETLYELVEANDNNKIEEEMDQNCFDDHSFNDPIKSKKRRIEISSDDNLQPRTIEYIINEETSELFPSDQDEIRESDHTLFDSKKFKRKSKAFGEYVGCLMRELNDDKLFYEAQNEILKIIEKTALKMVQK